MDDVKQHLEEGKITRLQYDLLHQIAARLAWAKSVGLDVDWDRDVYDEDPISWQDLPAGADLSERQFLGNIEHLIELDLVDPKLFYTAFDYNEDSLGEIAYAESEYFDDALKRSGFKQTKEVTFAEPEFWESPDGNQLFIIQHHKLAFQAFKVTKLGDGGTVEDFLKLLKEQ